MNIGFKYRRIGSFLIDLAIVRMFAQIGIGIYLGIVAYLSKGAGLSLSPESWMALPILLLLSVVVLLVFIGIYIGYHWLCYKLLGNSLSRYFLHLKVVSTDSREMTNRRYLKRELEKIVLCIATVGIYMFYSGAQFVAFGYLPYHDKRNKTKVVEY
ncbi:RDD family protein [Psychromonas antarctica]|uniref:RDD family protein n=1 Tax=Psychromonas antarctica TaxID=67573 RepID=UPI001EE91EBB|nr:RDD family protein [Psychromonas antarctica]MCG6202624.1 RDD family protein [Psychromonas antarctica]